MQVSSSTQTAPGSGKDRFLLEGTRSPLVEAVEGMIAQIAPTNIPVLLVGESGTGKETLAQHIHEISFRADKPFVKAICASLTNEPLVAHFGNNHHAGSNNGQQGAGTLFLKEIGELDPTSQRNLLYSIPQQGCAPADSFSGPRLISSTTRNLEEEVKAGRFRADLYYHIGAVSVPVPPLRQRREDIPGFVELFLTKYSRLLERQRPHLDSQDFALLEAFSWPGNIRELENVVLKIVVLNDPKAVLSQLALKMADSSVTVSTSKISPLKTAARAASHRTERQLILETLAKTRWNRKRAAQELQISYKALLYKLKQIRADEQEPV